jgi:transcriptional regulator with XRE-family HTH domain
MTTTLDPVRVQQIARDNLTELLRRSGDEAKLRGKRQAKIAHDSWLDESYVSRLLSGERVNPSRDALILLSAFGLELPVEGVDELLIAADYKPLVLPASLR